MNQLKRIIVSMLVCVVVFASSLWSGTTGKIAGTITDKKTGENLPAVNVVVLETSLGAVTDFNGEYSVLQVPPGTFKIQVSLIGYKKLIISDVHVFIDQTARVDIALDPETIEVTETVILGERPIKLDVATSVVDVSSKEITTLPVVNVTDVLNMQAGIQNGINIRGGSDDQALFMLDGVAARDPRNNKPLTQVAMSSVKAISVERGGFTAEYGQVQSGVINVVTNEGNVKGYSGSFTLHYTPPAAKYFRGDGIPDVQDVNSYWLRPYFDPTVCWTGTNNGAWDKYTIRHFLSFSGWNAISQALLSDNDPNNDLTPLGAQRAFEYEIRKKQITDQPDYNIDGGFGGPVPLVSEALGNLRFFTSYRATRAMLLFPMSRPDYQDYDWRLMVTSDVTKNMKLRISGSIGNVATMADNWNYGNYIRYPSDIANGTGGQVLLNMFGDFAYSLSDIGHQSLSAKMTHVLSDKTYYEVSLDYVGTKYDTRPPAARDTSVKYEIFPGFSETSNPYGYFPDISDGIIVNNGQQEALARDNSISRELTFKADITSQIDFNNMMKAGVEYSYNDLNLDYGFIAMQTDGKTYASRVQMDNFPVRLGTYFQDKLETNGFTMNAGLRLDYSNSRTDWWAFNAFDPNFYSSTYSNQQGFAMTKSEAQWQISPRFGISHPITENSKLYFNYGHYKQMPQYETLFRDSRRNDNSLAAIGDPNLKLAKTVSYELGYDHQLFDNQLLLQVTAYYRDVTNQQNTTTYYPIGASSYTLTTSTAYQDVRGFEVTLKKSTGRWFAGFINYTYQATSNGHFGVSEWYEDPSAQVTNYDNRTDKYYQNRTIPAPYARANLNFSIPQDFGPKVFDHNIIGDIMVNLLLNWSQGGWATYNQHNLPGVTNNVQYVDYFDGTLRASKAVTVKQFTFELFADISNLFDTRRLRLSYGDLTTSGYYINSLHLQQSKAYDNIPGEDKIGDYRDPSVDFQPEVAVQTISTPSTDYRTIFYERSSGIYWKIDATSKTWVRVDQATLDKINSSKAYIEMPDPSTYWFLNPRNITIGLRVSLNLD